MSKELPSIEDFANNNNLPSIDEFITEEVDQQLPSVEDYIEKEEVDLNEESINVSGDFNGTLIVGDSKDQENQSEAYLIAKILELISEVRKDIPEIPEIKYYDEELERLCEIVDQVRSEIPEVRYYEEDIERLEQNIQDVKDQIPTFPKWVNEVNEVPDFSWIGKTFSVIDDDFIKVDDKIETLRENVKLDLDSLIEETEVKFFENKVEIESNIKQLDEKYQEAKDRIWKELRESSLKIWEYHKEFKDDDRKLKKQITNEYNTLKQSLEEKIRVFNENSVNTDKVLLNYFETLKEEISGLPKVKYYDEDLKHVTNDIKDLYSLVETIKIEQRDLQENILREPPQEKESIGVEPDPLTPMDQKFATLDDLANHYRIFINRIQTQLSTMGGGGAGFIKDLDDVSFDQTTGNGKLLIYDQSNSRWVGIASTALSTGGDLNTTLGLGNTSSLGMIVGVVTATGFVGDLTGNADTATYADNAGIATYATSAGISTVSEGLTGTPDIEVRNIIGVAATFTGNVSIAGTLTYEDVTNVDSIGLITARSGINVLSGGIDAVGVVTATGFVGDLTGNADTATYASSAGIATYSDNSGIATYASSAGIATYSDNTGIATYSSLSGISTSVIGGIASVSQLSVENILHTGIATFGSLNGIGTVYVGLGSTALFVDGDARITGILTIGRASVTIDGDNNTITAGDVLITGSSVTIGDNVTINTGATGINSAPNVIYVAKDGNDSKNGTSIDNAKLTITGAVAIAQSGTTIKVLSGTYNENNPIEVPAFVSIVGDSLKTVTVIPNNSTEDIFHVNKGTYLANMTFVGHTAPAAAVAFPAGGAANVGGGKWESPYIQNCTSNTTTGAGMRIDGDLAEGLKSMVVDSYTQYNQGGVGIAVTNNGYAQLVSVFTICCNEGITAYKGGQCSLTNSNTDFGTYGLVADGTSDLQFTGIVTTSASVGTDTVAVAINTTTRPYEGQVLYFDTLYYTVESITVTNGGSGYTSTPSVTVGTPTGPNGATATAFATLNGDAVSEITIISSGSQYTEAPTVTISAPDSGTTATASANTAPIYYTINSSTPVTSGITTITLDENLNNTVGVGTTAYFYQVSRITASSHTFEYVGTGNDITTATPLRGGVPVQENEVVTRNGGRVDFTSTDQAGNFRIGDGIVINQNNGTISGRAFTRSLFSQMTPFILALS